MENSLAIALQPVESPAVGVATPDPVNDYGDHLSRLVAYFEEAEGGGREARERSERCRDYYNNIQLTAAELAALKKRGQPPIYVNYIQRKVDTLCGIERRSRTDPKAFPRNPADEQTSQAATDALRYVADQNRFNGLRSEVYNDILVEGCGGADVTVEKLPNGDMMIKTTRIPWDRLVYDVHSRELNFSDVRYKGIVIWMDGDEARERWPEFIDSIDGTLSTSGSETYDDRPKYGIWCDSKRKRVRVVQMHYKEGEDWFIATYTKGGFLEPPQVSPYVDEFGRSTSSLHLRAAYVDRENNRYGHVEGLIPLQDEINKRRSKALHLISQRQTFGKKMALLDTAKAKIELAKPDGHVEMHDAAEFGKDFGVIPTNDMAASQFQMLNQALQEMNATGANAAMQGKDEKAQSGVALQTKIQAGNVEMEPLADGLREWTKEIFDAMWLRVKQFWTAEKWIRVTDDDRNVKFVGLNKQITVADQLAQMGPEMAAQKMQQMGLRPGDPRLEQVVGVENDVSGLVVDIVIEEGPDLSSLQSEQFSMLADLAKSGIAIPPKAIIQASSIRNKDQILDEMEKGAQVPPEVQKQMQEMQQKLQQAEQRIQQQDMQLQNKSRELDIREQDMRNKAMAAMQKSGQQEPGDPLLGLEAEQKVADIDQTRADTQKTIVETVMLTRPQPEPQQRRAP